MAPAGDAPMAAWMDSPGWTAITGEPMAVVLKRQIRAQTIAVLDMMVF